MKKTILSVLMMLFAFSISQCVYGQSWRAELHAGESAVYAGLDYKGYLSSGYYRLGGDIIYNDHDEEEYRLLDGRFTVGSDALAQGLQCELGLKLLIGEVENNHHDGDVTAIAFLGRAAYFLPGNALPIPVRFSASLAGAPSPLAMIDLDSYSELTLDASFFVVENAALVLGYHSYHFKMDDSDDWKTSDDTITIGIELNF